MSVWADIHKRSNGILIRKEDVDTEIVSSLNRISDELDSRNPCMLKVFSMDKQGRIFTNIVQCHVVNIINLQINLQSPQKVMRKTLNIDWNINRIKSAIGDRRFISLEKV